MKPLAIALLAALLASCCLTDSVEGGAVSNDITTDTIWNHSSSPYIVDSNVRVLKGVKLTVCANVTVKFCSGKTLRIEGMLSAIGSKSSPVLFTSNSRTPLAGDWTGVLVVNGTVLCQNLTISYAQCALSAVNSEIILDSCTITNNEQAIEAKGHAIAKPPFAVRPVVICKSGSPWFVMSNCDISGNTGAKYVCLLSSGTLMNFASIDSDNFLDVRQNRITNNAAQYSIIEAGAGCGSGFSLISNDISENTAQCVINMTAFGKIRGNSIKKNAVGNVINLVAYLVEIAGNCISENTVSGSVISVEPRALGERTKIFGNDIVRNAGGVSIRMCEARNTKTLNTVDVTNNYWGTNDASVIRSVIYDSFQDPKRGTVKYLPFAIKPFTK